MKQVRFLLTFIMVLICLMFSSARVSANSSELKDKSEKELRKYANENNTWVVCYHQGKRTGSFFQYDSNSEYMYFSYPKQGCVDVYDMHGTFLYSFIFPDRQNGGICVRCENDQVYIRTKDNVLYIFSGIEEVACMDYDEATTNGYDFFWFYDNNPNITVDSTWIRWHDNRGELVREIKTPAVIKQTMPADGFPSIFKLFILVFIVILVAYVRILIKKYNGR